MEQALSDIKVIDLTWHVTGPYCTKLLADYGADVIKVERPGAGDPARSYTPFLHDDPHPEKSGLFLHLNTNKRSITLNLKSEDGKKIFFQLIEDADLLIENFSPGVMERLSIDYSKVEIVNHELVMLSISNFGQTGPYRDYKASELIINAMGTSMNSNGNNQSPPLKLGGRVIQYQSGAVAAVAAMTGLWTSTTQGIGQHIDLAIVETQLGSIDRRGAYLMANQYTGETSKRMAPGASLWSGYPDGIYPCKDGYWDTIGGVMWWPIIFKMLGEPEALADPRYGSPEWQRDPERQAEIAAVFMPWSMARTKAEIIEEANKVRHTIAPISTVGDLPSNPQLEARGFFVDVEHPVVGKVKQPGPPFQAKEATWAVRRPAPLLGEHNEEVYGQLGYSNRDMVRMRASGII